MTNKVRAGLYEVTYQVNDETSAVYQIERNNGNWNAPQNSWFIRTIIADEEMLSTEHYPSKKAALQVAAEMAGNWKHYPRLGWCYTGK